MEAMLQNKTDKEITFLLKEEGAFNVSQLKRKILVSESSLKKKLSDLVQNNILIKTADKRREIFYKLAKTENGLAFFLKNIQEANIEEIARAWSVSVLSAKKYIKPFIDQGILTKIGKPPKKIIYILNQTSTQKPKYSQEESDLLNNFFLHISPEGRMFQGVSGFQTFLNQYFSKTKWQKVTSIYLKALREHYQENHFYQEKKLFDITTKLNSLPHKNLKKVFSADLQNIPTIGKSKLYQLVEVSKAGQLDSSLMATIIKEMEEGLKNIIYQYQIEAVAFIPPTIKRKVQLISFLKNRLDLNLAEIVLQKNNSLLPVQQKNLKRLDSKLLHAKKSIIIRNNKEKHNNILLIDDVVDSGATLNETAGKIIKSGLGQNVYGFSIVANFKPNQKKEPVVKNTKQQRINKTEMFQP